MGINIGKIEYKNINNQYTYDAAKSSPQNQQIDIEDIDYNEDYDSIFTEFLCYAQNRLFTYFEEYRRENADSVNKRKKNYFYSYCDINNNNNSQTAKKSERATKYYY